MKRIILIILSVIAVLFPLSMLIYSIIFSENEEKKENSNIESEEKKITCSNIKLTDFNSTIDFSGKVVSSNIVPVISEVTGVFLDVNENKFEVGRSFKKGEVLIKIDCADLDFQLRSSKIEFKQFLLQILPDLKSDFPSSYDDWYNYANNFQIEGDLLKHPVSESDKQTNFLASRGLLSSFVQLQRIQTQVDKSTIIAPFDGVVTESLLSFGMNILPTQKLGTFMDDKNFEVISSFSLEDSKFLDLGTKATIYADDSNYYAVIPEDISVELIRKGSHIDPFTQGIEVHFQLSNFNLPHGIFVNGSVPINLIGEFVKIHKEYLINKKYVWLNVNGKINKKEVRTVFFENDSVVITGLNDKDCLINDYQNYFFDGMELD